MDKKPCAKYDLIHYDLNESFLLYFAGNKSHMLRKDDTEKSKNLLYVNNDNNSRKVA